MSESGAKLYVSARGNVQMLDRLDLNGDGNLDIVFCNGRQTTPVSSYKTNSFLYWGPSFSKKQDLLTMGCADTAQADLNDDGYPDVIFANSKFSTSNKINSYIYWGSSTGISTSNSTQLPTHSANKTTVADINRDGYLDVIFCNHGYPSFETNSSIYLGSPSGFSSGNRLDLKTSGCSGVAIADLNKDGSLDIVFANERSNKTVHTNSYIYWGPTFSSSSRQGLPTTAVRGVSVADLGSGDGHLDIVFNSHDNGAKHRTNSYLYWGPTFSKKQELPTKGSSAVSIAELGYGAGLDIVFSNGYDDWSRQINSYIYWGPGYSTKLGLPTVGAGGNTIADYTGDGKLDIVFCNQHDDAMKNAASYLYKGPSPYSTKLTLSSTLASSSGSTDPGSVYNRKPIQTFTSRIHDAGVVYAKYTTLLWKASVPKKTSLKVQLRSAITKGGIASATWYGPTSTSDHYDLSVGASASINTKQHIGHRYVQYRVTFKHDFGNTPVLDRMQIAFTSASTCSKLSCADKTKSGCETDVDCGGEACAKCVNGKKCSAGTDCLSGVCTGGVCKVGCAHQPVSMKCAKDGSGIEWCRIPAGCYRMGSPTTEACRNSTDETQHEVTLTRSFEIMATEVTQKQYQAVMGNNPSHFKYCGTNCPVEGVGWHQAVAFCNELSKARGKKLCYTCTGSGSTLSCKEAAGSSGKDIYGCEGYRLPTDAEWEYSYRAGTSTALYNGTIRVSECYPCSGSNTGAHQIGWSCANSKVTYTGCSSSACGSCTACRGTNVVGSKLPNGWGLYDMAGNVWEWCHDPAQANLGSTSVVNPVGSGSSSRVLRGGAWDQFAERLRAAYRSSYTPNHQPNSYGFRCVRTSKP